MVYKIKCIDMESTMFDFSGFYDRIAEQMPDNCKVCEVGVADGESALYLADRLNKLGKNFTLYMVDNLDYGKYIQLCHIYENIIKSGLGGNIKVIPKDSIEASKDFNDGELHFIFLDSSHEYLETKESIINWYPKLLDNGIFSGHDYHLYEGVRNAVDELIPTHFKRTDIPDREFDYEKVLNIEYTEKGYGLFWMQKQWYLQLNK